MTPELLHLYQELAKIGAYFIRYPNDSKLHLIVIDKPTISKIYEFGVPEVRRQLLLHLFGTEELQPHRQSCFCVSCQLYNIEEKSPAVICQLCNFLSECYAYQYLGKINRRASYILQRHCIDHSQIENCPHRDEATVELTRVIPPPDYSHLVSNDSPQTQVNMEEQCVGAQWIPNREVLVPCGSRDSGMGARISAPDRASSAGASANEGAGIPRRG